MQRSALCRSRREPLNAYERNFADFVDVESTHRPGRPIETAAMPLRGPQRQREGGGGLKMVCLVFFHWTKVRAWNARKIGCRRVANVALIKWQNWERTLQMCVVKRHVVMILICDISWYDLRYFTRPFASSFRDGASSCNSLLMRSKKTSSLHRTPRILLLVYRCNVSVFRRIAVIRKTVRNHWREVFEY